MYPHPIRLRGPWQCEATGGLARSVVLPARWDALGLADGQGGVRFRRRFGYPGQIDSEERVWLTLANLAGPCAVTLNGTHLATTSAGSPWLEWDVTVLLRPRNEVCLDLSGPASGEQPWTEVALEVRSLAFLRGIQVAAVAVEGQLEVEVRGEVVGSADRPLDLYVLLDRHQAAYDRVQPRPEGQAFVLRSQGVPPERWQARPVAVQVDLVKGATVWYTLTARLA